MTGMSSVTGKGSSINLWNSQSHSLYKSLRIWYTRVYSIGRANLHFLLLWLQTAADPPTPVQQDIPMRKITNNHDKDNKVI